jgi:hypothetical protein
MGDKNKPNNSFGHAPGSSRASLYLLRAVESGEFDWSDLTTKSDTEALSEIIVI